MEELLLACNVQGTVNADTPRISVQYGTKKKDNVLTVPLTVLHSDCCTEQWTGVYWKALPHPNWSLHKSASLSFGWIEVEYTRNLSEVTRLCYQQMFEICKDVGTPHVLRTWNYFPHINAGKPSSQYQLFCEGRATAYAKLNTKEQDYPAATVIGTQQSSFILMFIAGEQPGHGIENPRQTSAFHYPKVYSEHSPLFSRALVYQNEKQLQLYISGTASITGHATQHYDDVEQQTKEVLNNLNSLIAEAQEKYPFEDFSLRDFAQLKVFVKQEEDLSTIQALLSKELNEDTPICYLHGEMCRPDLLVEIEGTFLQAR